MSELSKAMSYLMDDYRDAIEAELNRPYLFFGLRSEYGTDSYYAYRNWYKIGDNIFPRILKLERLRDKKIEKFKRGKQMFKDWWNDEEFIDDY